MPKLLPPPMASGAGCMGAGEGWTVPYWPNQGEPATGAGLGPIWLRLTLGLLGVKRESRADMSGGPGWVRELKLGVLVVVAMPPYRLGPGARMARPRPPAGKPTAGLKPLVMEGGLEEGKAGMGLVCRGPRGEGDCAPCASL